MLASRIGFIFRGGFEFGLIGDPSDRILANFRIYLLGLLEPFLELLGIYIGDLLN